MIENKPFPEAVRATRRGYACILLIVFLHLIPGWIFAQELAPAASHPFRYGFVNIRNSSGNIPARYPDARGFSQGLAAVEKRGKWGYINTEGDPVIDFRFDYVRSFKNQQAIVYQGTFYGVIDPEGKLVIPVDYYDLVSFELNGEQFYISRDQSFFQGILDHKGKEVLPHRYTYVITYQSNLSDRPLYRNIAFYTAFQSIDTAKGSFLSQFKDNALNFSPGKGRLTIYDMQFNPLASKTATDFQQGFSHEELGRIDEFLEKNKTKTLKDKRKCIDSLLALSPGNSRDTSGDSLSFTPEGEENQAVYAHLKKLGYRLFTKDGKTGLKKADSVLIPARHSGLLLIRQFLQVSPATDLGILRTHYAGRFRDKFQDLFEIYAAIPHDGDPRAARELYSLSGTFQLPLTLRENKVNTRISKVTPLGFLYRTTSRDTNGEVRKMFSLADWSGKQVFPPVYQRIQVLPTGHVVLTREDKSGDSGKPILGLFSHTGKKIIPEGVFTALEFLDDSDGLYLLAGCREGEAGEERPLKYQNQAYAIISVKGQSYTVSNRFEASRVSGANLDAVSGMLLYRKDARERREGINPEQKE